MRGKVKKRAPREVNGWFYPRAQSCIVFKALPFRMQMLIKKTFQMFCVLKAFPPTRKPASFRPPPHLEFPLLSKQTRVRAKNKKRTKTTLPCYPAVPPNP